MAKKKQTSRESSTKLGELASDVLRDKRSGKKAKKLAGSVLSQRAPKKKK